MIASSPNPNISRRSGPWRITFDTNPDTCNINCIMCEEHSDYRNKNCEGEVKVKDIRMMDPSIISSVIHSAVPYELKEIIPSTMGEPLLYPYFDEFIQQAKDNRLRINLTTNGTFPGKGVEEWGNLILPVASDVKISINGPHAILNETIMKGINHEYQLRNMERFIAVRDEVRSSGSNHPNVTMQVTFMESNIDELPELVQLAIDMGADRIKGHHLWVTWPELKSQSMQRSQESRQRWNTMVKTLIDIANKNPLQDGSTLRLDNIVPFTENGDSPIISSDWLCPFAGQEAWIAWDGTFNVCCCPDAQRRTLGHFGNVSETDFIKLWERRTYNNFIQKSGSYEVCNVCNMRRPHVEEA